LVNMATPMKEGFEGTGENFDVADSLSTAVSET
jgi:hypothetical protein